jgi:hypothetical protein
MRRSLKVLLATGAVLVLLGACPSQAQDCRSLSQARRANPDVHLYYRLEGRKAGGRKCWYARGEPTRYRLATRTEAAKPVIAEEEPRRTIFDEIFSFFTPRPAVAAEEEEEKPRKVTKKKPVKVAQRRRPESQQSIDQKVNDICGPFDYGYCMREQQRRAQ